MSTEAIDAEHKPLAIVEERAAVDLFSNMRPAEKLAYAREVATVLRGMLLQGKIVINAEGKEERKPLIIRIPQKKNGVIVGYSEHVEVEGWETCGMLCGGVTAPLRWTQPTEDGKGARAFAEAVYKGEVIGAGTGRCDKGERRWSTADMYAIESMSQTRARSKAFRNVLSWIMVLAGFSPTPAEEVPPGGFEEPGKKRRPEGGGTDTPSGDVPAAGADVDEDTEENREHWRKQVQRYGGNRKIPTPHRHEIAHAFFGQASTKAQPDEGEPLTASQLHIIYRVLITYVRDRDKDPKAFVDDFDGWLEYAVNRWQEQQNG